jgi:hypothetical protein
LYDTSECQEPDTFDLICDIANDETMLSLPAYKTDGLIHVVSSSIPNKKRDIRIPSGYAIANLRVIGSGWSHASLNSVEREIITIAIEDFSNTFAIFHDPACCLPTFDRSLFDADYTVFKIDSINDVEYDIVFPTSRLVHEAIFKVHNVEVIYPQRTTKIHPHMPIELRSDTEIENPCLMIEESGLAVPFVKHLNVWKLELDTHMLFKGQMLTINPNQSTTNAIRMYMHAPSMMHPIDPETYMPGCAVPDCMLMRN